MAFSNERVAQSNSQNVTGDIEFFVELANSLKHTPPKIQVTNGDGSLDIYIQHEAPSDEKQRANWLPAPEGGFYMNFRLYVPDDSLQKGTWKPPVVQVVN